ncbi:MAG: hypothetical protein ACFFCS_04595 [Candidatus Hodarchaeota archaeon]
MSYIPKYILKRMIPKDAVSNTDYGWVVKLTNVISPLSVDEIPDNVASLFTISVDDNELDVNNLALAYEDKEVTMENPSAALGVTVPVGGVIEIRYKGDKLSAGKHSFKLEIQASGGMGIEFEREVA